MLFHKDDWRKDDNQTHFGFDFTDLLRFDFIDLTRFFIDFDFLQVANSVHSSD